MRPKKEGVEYLTDAALVILMMAIPLVIEDLVVEGNTVYFGFKSEKIEPYLWKFEHNEPIVIEDGKRYILAYTMFKTIVRRVMENGRYE